MSRPKSALRANKSRRHRAQQRKRSRPSLRFTPSAWAKLLFLRDLGPTEVGGFGISSESDPLLVEDIALVRQSCTAVTVRFEDDSVADHFDRCVDAGLQPERFARMWVHTHPGESPRPSGTDERTFSRVFGGCDWAVMAILARGGRSYARLRFGAGPGGDLRLPVRVDYSAPFAGSDPTGWAQEYASCVEDTSFGLNQQRRFSDAPALGDELTASFAHETSDGFDAFDFEFDPFAFRGFTFTDPHLDTWEHHDEHSVSTGGGGYARVREPG